MLVSYRDTIWTMKEAYLHLGRKQMEQWHWWPALMSIKICVTNQRSIVANYRCNVAT
jgi:hypothetical protein